MRLLKLLKDALWRLTAGILGQHPNPRFGVSPEYWTLDMAQLEDRVLYSASPLPVDLVDADGGDVADPFAASADGPDEIGGKDETSLQHRDDDGIAKPRRADGAGEFVDSAGDVLGAE